MDGTQQLNLQGRVPSASHHYVMHGLTVESEWEFPSIPPASASAEVDVRMVLDEVPLEVAAPAASVEDFQVGKHDILLTIPRIARYWATGGHTIIVKPARNADPDAVRLYLLGSGLAAILHQRGLWPLHASAIEHKGRCIGFVGDSGAGKSTLVSLLARRGKKLLSDDVLVSKAGKGRTAIAEPGLPILKLFPESILASGFDTRPAPLEYAGFNKHRIPAADNFTNKARTIDRLYVLSWMLPQSAAPEFERKTAFAAMMALRANIYAQCLIGTMRREQDFMEFASRFLAHARVFDFRRAMNFPRAEAQVDMLIRHFDTEE